MGGDSSDMKSTFNLGSRTNLRMTRYGVALRYLSQCVALKRAQSPECFFRAGFSPLATLSDSAGKPIQLQQKFPIVNRIQYTSTPIF